MRQLIFNKYIITFLLLVSIQGYTWARPNEEKTKEIHKTYKVSKNTEISISNSFGKVHIDTWDRNEVDIRIRIIATGSSEERAMDLLNKININIDDKNPLSELSFSTSMASKMNTRKSESFEINYEVKMPKKNSLDLKNSFGDTYLDDYDGSLDIKVSYGNLTTGYLSGNSDIKISFGNGISEMRGMSTGDLKVSYSKLDVEKLGTIDLNAQFSTIKVEKAGTIDLVAKYGKVTFEEVDIMEANVSFSGFEIQKLNKELDLDVDYGNDIYIGGISSTIDFITIKNSFGPVTLELSENIHGNLTADMSYCDLKYPEGLIDFKKIIKDNTSKEYEGTIGEGGKTQIDIDSKYGNVRIRN